MTRTYALMKLLEHGELTRQELREITGWTEKQLCSAINYLTDLEKIKNVKRKWRLIESS